MSDTEVGGIKGFEFEVLQSDSRQIKRVKIKRLKHPKPRLPRPPAATTTKPVEAGTTEAPPAE